MSAEETLREVIDKSEMIGALGGTRHVHSIQVERDRLRDEFEERLMLLDELLTVLPLEIRDDPRVRWNDLNALRFLIARFEQGEVEIRPRAK